MQSGEFGMAYSNTELKSKNGSTEEAELLREDDKSSVNSGVKAFFSLDICKKPMAEPWHICKSTLKSHPFILPSLRITFTVYMLAAYVGAIASGEIEIGKFFFYLTNLAFSMLMLYFGATGYHSLRYAMNPSILEKYKENYSQFYWVILQFLYTLNLPIHLLVSSVYWILIYKHHIASDEFVFTPVLHWVNISIHGLNFLFVVVEFCLNQQRLYPLYVIPYVILSGFYLVFTIIGSLIHSTPEKRWYVYNAFLRWDEENAIWMHIGMLSASILFFLFSYLLHYVKYAVIKAYSKRTKVFYFQPTNIPIPSTTTTSVMYPPLYPLNEEIQFKKCVMIEMVKPSIVNSSNIYATTNLISA